MTINAVNHSFGSYPHGMYASAQRLPVTQVRPVYNHANNYRYNLYSNAMDSGSKLFLKQFENQFRSLMTASNHLSLANPQNAWNNLSAKTADASVATITNAQYLKQPAQYQLDVQQVAEAQVNQSKQLDSQSPSTLSASQLALNINGKQYHIGLDTTRKSNEQVLSDLAHSINSQQAGITAEVITKANSSYLQLSGQQTGTANQFSFSGNEEVISQLGLNQVTQQSQNAIVSVAKQGHSAQTIEQASNNIILDSYRLSFNVHKTGKTALVIEADQDQLIQSVKNLVSTHNDTIQFLNDNADRGVAIPKHLANLILPPISEQSMASIGLSYKDDGTLAFDEQRFTTTLGKRPEIVKSALSGNYSISSGFTSDAQKALQESAIQLINGTTSTPNTTDNSQTQQNISQQLKLASMYSRYGAYHQINASVIGLFFNTLA